MVQENCVKNKAIIICGPTASGKTALAVECAKLLNSAVISADSMYIYKGLDIGTAKPFKEEMQGIKHYMIDVASPNDCFSVSDYKSLAEPILNSLFNGGKIPIICGGTGFYINSLLYDLSYGLGGANLEAREKYFELAKQYGNEYVFKILKEKDEETAKKLHFNDIKRVIRALEICENGLKKSDIVDNLVPKFSYNAYTISHDRKILYGRINDRVNVMINSGLIDEVQGLLDTGISRHAQCMQGIGYKEIIDYIDNKISLEDAIELIKLNTRHYAKRQITFFKKMPNLVYLEPDSINKLAKRICDQL